MIRLQGTGHVILELCDGRRTLADIVNALAERFTGADPAKIRSDVAAFLDGLQKKRIIDY